MIATYRELVHLHSNLADEIGRYRNEVRDLPVVLFPEFTQVFADPCRPTALAILKLYSSAQAFATANLEELTLKLQELSNGHYALKTAQQLIELASHSATSGVAHTARATGLVILCDQLAHTQHNLTQLEAEIEKLMQQDQAAVTLEKIPEFGPKTVAGLRAELGEITRFSNTNQVVAYAGMDLTVKESGKWKGRTKLSKRGSGRLRHLLYMAALVSLRLKTSAFGEYYRELRKCGLNGRNALMAVVHKLLLTAYSLLKNDSGYDPKKVWAESVLKVEEPTTLQIV